MLKVYLAPKPEAITNNLQKVQTQKKISQPLKAVTLQKDRATGSQNIGKKSEGISHQSSMEISAGKSASPLPQNRISPEAVLESARHFAIEEVRKQAPSKEKNLPLNERPASAALARILSEKTEETGITQYTDGHIKVVTPSGTVYCERKQEGFPQIGPVDLISIPMTCP